jgi:hypothetical protein
MSQAIPKNVVLILGAGATVSDVSRRALRRRPPLDKGFFRIGGYSHPALAGTIDQYMRSTYAVDIREPISDSLESVMGQIYTDMFNPMLEDAATDAFRALLRLFTRRLAETTNNIRPTNRRWVYRILARFFAAGVSPENLVVITFNQDIQVEKLLCLMSETPRWASLADRLFSFPGCYGIGIPTMTSPTGSGPHDLFDAQRNPSDCVRVLKLHGSLNWYSTHISRNPTPTAMFRQSRRIALTRRQIIDPGMTLSGQRSTYALPVVVPPVSHKSAVLHNVLQGVWRQAEDALRKADEILVFGYSCPQLDFESSNLLRRSQIGRDTWVTLIDPNPAAADRYIDLPSPTRLTYYPSAGAYAADRAGPIP